MVNKNQRVSIVIPVYNEEKRLARCLDCLLKFIAEQNKTFEIIVSADGCTDKTVEIVEDFAKKNSQIKFVQFHERLGKGGGILNALRISTGDLIVIIDVDLSAPPEQIPKMLTALEEEKADLVFGSRNLPGSIILVEPPIYRKLLGKAFNFIFRLLFRIDLHDTQCGFKAIKKDVLDDLSGNLNIEGYAFDVNLAVSAKVHGYRIIEVPIIWRYEKGTKVDTVRQILVMGHDLLVVWFEQKKRGITTSDEISRKRFYDSIPGDVYDNATRSWFLPRRLWHLNKNKTISRNIPDEDLNVLDAGCGSGTLIETLSINGRSVYCLDIGKSFIRFTKSRHNRKNTYFICADVQYLPLRTGFLDTVVCSEVLEHVKNQEKTLKEFYRVLRYGGRLILTTPNISLRWSIIEAVWTRMRRQIIETDHKSFTKRRITYLLSITGFSILLSQTMMLGCLILVEAEK